MAAQNPEIVLRLVEAARLGLGEHTALDQLRHVVERVSILSEAEVIGEEEVTHRLGRTRAGDTIDELMPIRDMERRMIVLALNRFDGDKPTVAKILGIALKTLYNKLNQAAALEQSA